MATTRYVFTTNDAEMPGEEDLFKQLCCDGCDREAAVTGVLDGHVEVLQGADDLQEVEMCDKRCDGSL